MPEPKQSCFEGWAVVELMGHQREIGYVTTEAYGQSVMFRIDTPGLDEREYELPRPEYVEHHWMPAGTKVKRPASPARSRLVDPGSLYAINPCSEEAARQAIESSASRPLILIERPAQAQIEAAMDDEQIDEGDVYEDDEEAV